MNYLLAYRSIVIFIGFVLHTLFGLAVLMCVAVLLVQAGLWDTGCLRGGRVSLLSGIFFTVGEVAL